MSETFNKANKEYRLDFCDHILDNNYGQIGITLVEKKLERLPIFKRLHEVSQLGLVNWIFSCALHSRYVHSIGVMYIAGEMARHININSKEPFFSDGEIQIIRLAGMLHDIGHYPMSHNVEQVYKRLNEDDDHRMSREFLGNKLDKLVNCPDFLNPLKKLHDDEITDNDAKEFEKDMSRGLNGSQLYHHEAVGKEIITNNKAIRKTILENFVLSQTSDKKFELNPFFAEEKKEEYSSDDVKKIVDALLEMIGNIIIGKYNYIPDNKYVWAQKYSAMVQILHSEMDADNIDYLLRDAAFSGTSYGIMDMSMLFNSIKVAKLNYQDAERFPDRYLVGVLPKGVGSVDQFLLNKYLAYTQMTYSKYVSILEAMLSFICLGWLKTDKDYNLESLMNKIKSEKTDEHYLSFTDGYILRKLAESQASDNARDLPKYIISHLKHFCAFRLYDEFDKNRCECIATGNQEQIVNTMKESSVYKDFQNVCNSFEKLSYDDFNRTQKDVELFAFRFEKYSLTKQIPFEEFDKKIKGFRKFSAVSPCFAGFSQNKICKFSFVPPKNFRITKIKSITGIQLETILNFHYFRLANGIPVLEQESYEFTDNLSTLKKQVPNLIVDYPGSILHTFHNQQFVALRKYRVREAEVDM